MISLMLMVLRVRELSPVMVFGGEPLGGNWTGLGPSGGAPWNPWWFSSRPHGPRQMHVLPLSCQATLCPALGLCQEQCHHQGPTQQGPA